MIMMTKMLVVMLMKVVIRKISLMIMIMKLKYSDMPVCANPEPEIYGVSKSELVDIVCRVQANPSEVRT